MKNITAQYRDLLEGKMSQANFLTNVRRDFPHLVTNINSFQDTVKILKSKRILSEVEIKNTNNETPKEIGFDHVNYYQLTKGTNYELERMDVISDENYVKARNKALDNIKKDPDAYRELIVHNVKDIKERDKDLQMVPVEKNNLVDKANAMKATQKDAKANTQTTLGKQESAKKGGIKKVKHMTMAPKRSKGVEYFETPGKEKVIALKEHLLKEFDESTKETENLTIGQRVMKNDGSKVGIITDLDTGTLTATVKWDDGEIEHVQTNVLTGKNVPEKSEKPVEEKRFNAKEAVNKLKELKEKILRRIKEDDTQSYETNNGEVVTASKETGDNLVNQGKLKNLPDENS
jgi:hypothetical protein